MHKRPKSKRQAGELSQQQLLRAAIADFNKVTVGIANIK